MPRKLVGENSKAAAARARKENVKEAEMNKQMQADEDAKWEDNDKKVMKKQHKKEELERKRLDVVQKKAVSKALLENEMGSIEKISKVPVKSSKAQIEAKIKPSTPKKEVKTHLDIPVEENINRSSIEGEIARTITEAINVLGLREQKVDKHPERRMKAAYAAFAERRLAEMKGANSTLKLSQQKQMIFKEWQKSPENPFNKV